MHFKAVIASLFVAGALAGPVSHRDNDNGLKRICPNLNTNDKGCIRCTLHHLAPCGTPGG